MHKGRKKASNTWTWTLLLLKTPLLEVLERGGQPVGATHVLRKEAHLLQHAHFRQILEGKILTKYYNWRPIAEGEDAAVTDTQRVMRWAQKLLWQRRSDQFQISGFKRTLRCKDKQVHSLPDGYI